MVLPLTDDAPKVTKEILGHALELTIHHPTIGPKICNKWITVDTIIDAIRAAAVIDASIGMNGRLLGTLLPKMAGCWALSSRRFRSMSRSIVLTEAICLVSSEQNIQNNHIISYCHRVSKPNTHYLLLEQGKKGTPVQRRATYIVNPQNTKSDSHERQQNSGQVSKSDSHERQKDSDHVDMPRQQSVSGTYWDSPEDKLFKPRQCDSNCLSAVERRIELLQRAQQFEGWRDLVHGRDPDNVCSNYDKLVIRQKSMFILKAYKIAILEMNRKTWLECCEIAVHEINLLGVTLTTRGDNLSRWHGLFRTREAFLHPNLEARVGRDPLPPFLRMFPDAATEIKQFCRVNLLNLNVETVHQFIWNKVFPKIYAVWASEQTSRGHTLQSFLKLFRISVFSPQTTLSWMKQLGMKYANHKKSYYVDGHEREDVVTSRKLFCKRYLVDLEPRCIRWIQITKEKVSELPSLSMDFGHEYMEGDIKMVEFHEDYIDKAGMDLTQFEKKQSVRAPPNSPPLEFIGQDECVFFQNLVCGKNWVGSNGERPLLPKSEGDGVMLSTFQSRLTGFGREMSTDELQKVNEERLNKTYWDGEAALEVLKSTSKPPLTASPFVRKLLIGINNEGYWNSNHMAVQFEDVVDCLKVLYPSHEFVFLFDHSQGHNRKRKGALDVNNMNVSFGGKQERLRDTIIQNFEGYLGRYSPLLSVGDTQRMNWSNEEPPEESTEGPFNLSVQERRKRRSTQLLDEYVNNKPKTKKELTTDLQREGIISKEDRRGYTVKEMQKLAGDHGIAISKSEQKKLTGWVGEPKGLLQVARERGLIDHNNHHLYSANPKKNPDGTLNDEKSLRSIVGQCTDFQNELTHLQVMANELKVQVMFTPKFHAEMAGEGIEYSWGFAKGSYRRKPLQKKRKRSDFEDLVDECTNVETELTKARIRRFSARARAYLCTYHYLATAEPTAAEPTAAAIQDNDQEKKQKVPMMDEIERLMKKFKTHRCAFDFDRGFVMDHGSLNPTSHTEIREL
ncbi:hypothetical protein IV203_014515 [Nitzschia inconspicua]|uniref:Uncharacterized protein n=2 Tax=Nitzschia inconspicua TaxID=303405 RepID=A0A9K3PSP2_9STRA|nr:hypothetical protein IV203_014489 [Nitzschia inconspicua]KAG7357928.1 hypothetical protein IV203_014515 [Nitzschia inconspicua]